MFNIMFLVDQPESVTFSWVCYAGQTPILRKQIAYTLEAGFLWRGSVLLMAKK
jgi:hypothetical protein